MNRDEFLRELSRELRRLPRWTIMWNFLTMRDRKMRKQ